MRYAYIVLVVLVTALVLLFKIQNLSASRCHFSGRA